MTGVPYDELGASASNLFLGAGLSLIIAAVLLAITTTLLGWWRPALFERHRSLRWPIIAPILMAVALLFNLASTDWGSYDGAFFAASLSIVLVGLGGTIEIAAGVFGLIAVAFVIRGANERLGAVSRETAAAAR